VSGFFLFKCLYVGQDADQKINVIVSVDHACFFIGVDVEMFLFPGWEDSDGLLFEVDVDLCCRVCIEGVEEVLEEVFADLHREQEVVQCVVPEDIGEEAADNDFESVVAYGPCRVFAAGSAAEIVTPEGPELPKVMPWLVSEVVA
jgi:hypothetical protein